MTGWWRRHPVFRRYMLREASAVAITAYALWLLAGLGCLVQGEAAFEAWRALGRTPLAVVLHALALPLLAFHSLTWFQVMPKTAPRLPFPARWLTVGGLLLAGGLSTLVLWLAWRAGA
jgi:fumarate reductase subunit C